VTVKLKNIGPVGVSLYAPSGGADAVDVGPGQIVEVPGTLIDNPENQLDDALHIQSATGELRAWPMSQWEVVSDGR
jgi:hypothetical protein